MRVAMVLEQCWHRVPGGTATSALGLARALAARPARDGEPAIEPVAVTAWHRGPPASEAFMPTAPRRAMPLPRHALYEAWHRFRFPPIELAVRDADVVHATGYVIPPTRRPLVVTIHDVAWRHDPTQFTARGVRLFERCLALTREHADAVVVPSESSAADCREAGIEDERLRVVPWGTDVRPATEDEVRATRRRYGLDARYVLWVGTIEPRKNVPRLLEAFAALRGHDDVLLVLAGPEGWGDDLAASVAAPRGRVRTLGFVGPDELRALYAGAAVVAYPSLREGFGLPVLEAMAQGAAVLTSSGTATAEVAGHAAVLVDPLDTTTIATGLQALLDDPLAATQLGERGRDRAASFTWARCADAHVEVYRRVLAG